MTPSFVRCARLVLAVFLVPAGSPASLPEQAPAPPADESRPEQDAARSFQAGTAYQEKADQLDKQAADETDAKKKEKLTKEGLGKYADAVEQFTQATRQNPKFFQAWGSLGYAYRKSGKYPESLAAYNKALEIQPGYTPAIEYRAEACLELDRLDDVKAAYMVLFQNDRRRADELSAAIEKWVAKRKAAPGSLDAKTLESFADWAAERRQVASQTSSLFRPPREGW